MPACVADEPRLLEDAHVLDRHLPAVEVDEARIRLDVRRVQGGLAHGAPAAEGTGGAGGRTPPAVGGTYHARRGLPKPRACRRRAGGGRSDQGFQRQLIVVPGAT